MTFDDYQQQAVTTMYTSTTAQDEVMGKTILAMGVAGEAGEVLEKWKKIIVYKEGMSTDEDVREIAKELGDVLWYVAVFADRLGLSVEDIAAQNLQKLQKRQSKNTISGEGDNR